MVKNCFLRILMICTLIIGLHLGVKAQPGDPDPDAVPLDPGSWVLVAAGVGYGVKKWKENKQQNKTNASGEENDISK